MSWTADELCAAIKRQGRGDQRIHFIDLAGKELPFRWMYGQQDGQDHVTIRLDIYAAEE
jgi:hypothetical protein